ncbi:hypothetical protein F1C16_17360 [Hymenobacter sp. NBH84]|uniref:hypothetical protein n=1 Tax=Hymenobacter sp. NBH84 TaxID=2596915 RepID=UPI001629FDF2|nr:hypothetical protein [Hymenobacter sp. NBH84]QNE41198.1 hypothetical protein F1C16_17360 [Hymenobacter sp. NBH84]
MRYTSSFGLPLLVGLSLLACTAVHKPVGFWSRNRYNAKLERQGPWRIYYDETERHLAAKGRFRRNYERGRWRYYSFNGQREKWELYHRQPGGLISIRHYDLTGKIQRQGQARYVNEPDGPHFYWFGPWCYFDAQGKMVKIETYEGGTRISSDSVAGK